MAELGTAPDGLVSGEAGRRLLDSGPNVLREQPRASAIGLYLDQFRSPLIISHLSAEAFVYPGLILIGINPCPGGTVLQWLRGPGIVAFTRAYGCVGTM